MNDLQDSNSSNPTITPLREYAERELSQHPLPAPKALPVDQLVEELQIHQLELEMQNESLRQLQLELEESRDRYRDLYEFSPIGYLTLNRQGVIVEINLTATALLGRDRNELINRHFAPLVAGQDADRWYLFAKDAMKKDGITSSAEVMIAGTGGTFIARVDCVSLKPPAPAGLRIALTDISASKRADMELRVAAIAFEAQEAMMVTDSAGVILRVNKAFADHTGFSPAELVGKTPAVLKSGRHDAFFYQQMWALLKKNGTWSGTIWNRYKNGKIYAEWLNLSAVYDGRGFISHYVSSYSSITQNREAEAEIHRLAYYDPLTQLPNRRFLQDRLEQTLTQCERKSCHGAVLFVDLDNFKVLNDAHGHDVGDLLLTMVARRLEAAAPAQSTVARLSGDEFVIVLEDLSSTAEEATQQARQIADAVCRALNQPYELRGPEFNCTASVGIVLFEGQQHGVKRLLKRADLALYQAKAAGRNRVHFFDADMQSQLDARNLLIHDMQQALVLDQFHLYYQIQVDHLYRAVSVEALLRWQHPKHGLLEPDTFIPLAEETGLILPIGQWVLRTACEQIRKWSERAGAPIHMAINVSARQFRQPNFVDDVKKALADTGADPACLGLELTESVVISDLQDTITKMHALKHMGIRLSMDDFGTGYSSLSTLSSLPLDQLKIDQSFIQKLNPNADANNEIVTQSIITLGRTLGLQVIAEGVETYNQLDFLERHGCNAYQGYLFGRPQTLSHLETSMLH